MATAISLPMRLRTTRRSMVLMLLACAAFVAGGVFVLPEHPIVGTQAIVFFGLGVAVALVNLLPGSSYLELDRNGFTTCTLFRKDSYRWEDVSEFWPLPMGRAKTMVAMRFTPNYREHATSRRFAKWLAGAEGALPDTYGRSAKDLAALLNEVRAAQTRKL